MEDPCGTGPSWQQSITALGGDPDAYYELWFAEAHDTEPVSTHKTRNRVTIVKALDRLTAAVEALVAKMP